MKNKLANFNRGFTLVELLIVMVILGILATLIVGNFRNAQIRGRDAQRKSDLREMANALELFYQDHGQYPDEAGGRLQACPYDPSTGSGTSCTWGEDEFTDGNTSYFKTLPKDPEEGQTYYYRIVSGSNNQKYQIFAHLENPKDQDCLGGDCENPPVTYSCGAGVTCNFAVTSANTTATEN